jgi:MFS transporter, MFS domain-containing protein family, molybdate-anion transporter
VRPPPQRASSPLAALSSSRPRALSSHLPPQPTNQQQNIVGDWLQGPYVYALYEHYGYSPAAIGQLFIAGFGSSLVFGTVVGALSDRLGRRNASLLYVLTYSLSCVTKHSPDFRVLMLGRVLGGIATSLLFSAFEAWLVAEHFRRGYSEASLGDTFAWAIFLGNGLMAIVAGFAGNFLVENLGLGRVAPFDAAIVAMLIGGAIMARTWTENYGDRTSKGIGEQFEKAWAAIVGGEILRLIFEIFEIFRDLLGLLF